MKHLFQKYRHVWTECGFIVSVLLGVFLLLLSLGLNFVLGTYASRNASNAVTDVILSNIPVLDVENLFIWGTWVFISFVFCIVLFEPKTIPFVLKSSAFFICIRSIFVSLTHIGPFPVPPLLDAGTLTNLINFTGDLFFSGHTGFPFLLALMFWHHRYLRWVFLGSSLFFAVIVLVGHFHYSIDVFAAFFITYGIFQLSKKAFSKDYTLFLKTHSFEE